MRRGGYGIIFIVLGIQDEIVLGLFDKFFWGLLNHSYIHITQSTQKLTAGMNIAIAIHCYLFSILSSSLT